MRQTLHPVGLNLCDSQNLLSETHRLLLFSTNRHV